VKAKKAEVESRRLTKGSVEAAESPANTEADAEGEGERGKFTMKVLRRL